MPSFKVLVVIGLTALAAIWAYQKIMKKPITSLGA